MLEMMLMIDVMRQKVTKRYIKKIFRKSAVKGVGHNGSNYEREAWSKNEIKAA